MNPDCIAAFALPANSRIDQRIPKKVLLERGDFSKADKRLITDQIEELMWVAALKPTNIGVPAYRDDLREVLEIAILSVEFRPAARVPRLTELIHRAIPYPVVLLSRLGHSCTLSLGDKRFSQNEAGKTILDGDVLSCSLDDHPARAAFLGSLAIVAQPRTDLWSLYQGWKNCVEAFLAAGITGTFSLAASPDVAAARRAALIQCDRLDREMAALRVQAGRETQMSRRVELNLTLQRLVAEREQLLAQL